MLYRSAALPCATPNFKHIYGGKLDPALKAGKLSASYCVALLAHDLATGAGAIRLSRKRAIAPTSSQPIRIPPCGRGLSNSHWCELDIVQGVPTCSACNSIAPGNLTVPSSW
jgi:hypothetical protein